MKGSRLTEQRLVPFEAARDVAYPYDRPRAFHRSLIAASPTDPDTSRQDGLNEVFAPGPTTVVFTRFQYMTELVFSAAGRVLSGWRIVNTEVEPPAAGRQISTYGVPLYSSDRPWEKGFER